jgi:hypothetical protein
MPKGDYGNFVAKEEHDPVFRVKRVSNFISDPDGSLTREVTTTLAVRIDEQAPVTYIGEATVGSATSGAVWRIRKIDASSGTVITWADGDTDFNNVWDDRASLTYN